MPTLKYWDAGAGQYVPLPVRGPKGPTGPTGNAGLQGRSAVPEVLIGTTEPQLGEDLWVLPDGGGAALMMRTDTGWVPRSDMGGARVTNVGTPTLPDDIATKGYVDTTVPMRDTAWKTLSYLNGWHTYPNGCPVRYRMTRDGAVIVAGQITGGTVPSPLAVLPPGYRPQYGLRVPIYSDHATNGFNRISVQADGYLVIEGGSNLYQCIDFMFIP